MEELANHYRERTVALLATMHDPSLLVPLATYGPPAEVANFARHWEAVAALPLAARQTACREHLAGLRVAEDVVLIGEVHPAWLTQVLEHESPLVVGLVLRYLPSRHVRYLMAHLPERLKRALPNLLETFAVAPVIFRLVRRMFEAHFVPMRPAQTIVHFHIPDLIHLSADELDTLLHDAGIHELALAFHTMERQALHLVFNRMQFRDAKALKERIQSFRNIHPGLERDAKQTIFEIGIDVGGSEAMLREIGVHGVAKAIGPNDMRMIETLRQKLPPRLGYLLSRLGDHYQARTHPAIRSLRQTLLLQRIAALSSAGELDARWKHCIPGVPVSGAGALESTATQMAALVEGAPAAMTP